MRKKLLLALTALGIGAGSVVAYQYVGRSDCPGVKTCPLTGQPICVDRCTAPN